MLLKLKKRVTIGWKFNGQKVRTVAVSTEKNRKNLRVQLKPTSNWRNKIMNTFKMNQLCCKATRKVNNRSEKKGGVFRKSALYFSAILPFIIMMPGQSLAASQALPVVSIVALEDSIIEGDQADWKVVVVPAPTEELTVEATVGSWYGRGGAGSSVTYTLTFKPGESEKHIARTTIDFINDSILAQDREVYGEIEEGSGYQVSSTDGRNIIYMRDSQLPTSEIAVIAGFWAYEGETVEFHITAGTATSQNREINLSVTADTNNILSAPVPTSVTLPAGKESVVLEIPTRTTPNALSTGNVTVRALPGSGYTVASAPYDRDTVHVSDNLRKFIKTQQSVNLSRVSHEIITEGEDAVFKLGLFHGNDGDVSNRTFKIGVTGTGNFLSSNSFEKTVIMPDGVIYHDFSIPTIGDDNVESNGSVTVKLLPDSNYIAVGAAQQTVRVADNDSSLVASLGQLSTEITEGTSPYFRVNLSQPAPPIEPDSPFGRITIKYEILAGSNFLSSQGGNANVLCFLPNSRCTFSLNTENDDVDEPDGSITIKLLNGTNPSYTASSTNNTVTVMVKDNDSYPAVSIARKQGTAGSITEDGMAVFTLTTETQFASETTVSVKLTQTSIDDSGTADFITGSLTRTVDFDANDTSAELEVRMSDDSVDEHDGVVTATLQYGSGYAVSASSSSAFVKVTDNDAAATISISGTNASESGSAQFSVTATAAVARTVFVTLAETSGSFVDWDSLGDPVASARLEDASNTSHALPASTYPVRIDGTSFTWNVPLDNDNVFEPDGTLTATVYWTSNIGYARSDSNHSASVTVTSDDLAPEISLVRIENGLVVQGNGTVTEGNPFQFRLSRTGSVFAADQAIRISVVQSASGIGNAAHFIESYLPAGVVSGTDSKTVTFGAGSTVENVDVTVQTDRNDGVDEENGTVTVTLLGSDDDTDTTNNTYTVNTSSSSVLVSVSDRDADVIRTLDLYSVAPGVAVEEADGAVAEFRAQVDTPGRKMNRPVYVVVADGDGDFIDWENLTTVTHSSGEEAIKVIMQNSHEVVFSVPIKNDAVDEAHGRIGARLLLDPGYQLGASPSDTVDVTDDDNPVVEISAVETQDENDAWVAASSVVEGERLRFAVSTENSVPVDSALTVRVRYGGSLNFLVAGTTADPFTVVIPANGHSVSHEVDTDGDSADEADGSLTLTVLADSESPATYSVGTNSTGSAAVSDNDNPVVEISAVETQDENDAWVAASSVAEGVRLRFAVSTENSVPVDSALTVRVQYGGINFLAAGTTADPFTVEIPADGHSVNHEVATDDDSADEASGNFTLTVLVDSQSQATYSVGTNGTGSVEVTDNDNPVIEISAVQIENPVLRGQTRRTYTDITTSLAAGEGDVVRWRIGTVGGIAADSAVTVNLSLGLTHNNDSPTTRLPNATSVTIDAGAHSKWYSYRLGEDSMDNYDANDGDVYGTAVLSLVANPSAYALTADSTKSSKSVAIGDDEDVLELASFTRTGTEAAAEGGSVAVEIAARRNVTPDAVTGRRPGETSSKSVTMAVDCGGSVQNLTLAAGSGSYRGDLAIPDDTVDRDASYTLTCTLSTPTDDAPDYAPPYTVTGGMLTLAIDNVADNDDGVPEISISAYRVEADGTDTALGADPAVQEGESIRFWVGTGGTNAAADISVSVTISKGSAEEDFITVPAGPITALIPAGSNVGKTIPIATTDTKLYAAADGSVTATVNDDSLDPATYSVGSAGSITVTVRDILPSIEIGRSARIEEVEGGNETRILLIVVNGRRSSTAMDVKVYVKHGADFILPEPVVLTVPAGKGAEGFPGGVTVPDNDFYDGNYELTYTLIGPEGSPPRSAGYAASTSTIFSKLGHSMVVQVKDDEDMRLWVSTSADAGNPVSSEWVDEGLGSDGGSDRIRFFVRGSSRIRSSDTLSVSFRISVSDAAHFTRLGQFSGSFGAVSTLTLTSSTVMDDVADFEFASAATESAAVHAHIELTLIDGPSYDLDAAHGNARVDVVDNEWPRISAASVVGVVRESDSHVAFNIKPRPRLMRKIAVNLMVGETGDMIKWSDAAEFSAPDQGISSQGNGTGGIDPEDTAFSMEDRRLRIHIPAASDRELSIRRVRIPLADDYLLEDDSEVMLTVLPGVGYRVHATNSNTRVVRDNDGSVHQLKVKVTGGVESVNEGAMPRFRISSNLNVRNSNVSAPSINLRFDLTGDFFASNPFGSQERYFTKTSGPGDEYAEYVLAATDALWVKRGTGSYFEFDVETVADDVNVFERDGGIRVTILPGQYGVLAEDSASVLVHDVAPAGFSIIALADEVDASEGSFKAQIRTAEVIDEEVTAWVNTYVLNPVTNTLVIKSTKPDISLDKGKSRWEVDVPIEGITGVGRHTLFADVFRIDDSRDKLAVSTDQRIRHPKCANPCTQITVVVQDTTVAMVPSPPVLPGYGLLEPPAPSRYGPAVLPEASLSPVEGSVEEGEDARFSLVLSHALSFDISVGVDVSWNGDFLASAPPAEVHVPAGSSESLLTVPTVDDDLDEADGSILVRILPGFGYFVAPAPSDRATVAVLDDDLGRRELNSAAVRAYAPAVLASAMESSVRAAEFRMSLGSRDFGNSPLQFEGAGSLPGMLESAGRALNEGDLSVLDLLGGTSFALNLSPAGGSDAAGMVWGFGDTRAVAAGQGGRVASGHIGFDARLAPGFTAGFSMSAADGLLEFATDDDEGRYGTSMTGLHQHLGWSAADGDTVAWSSAGYSAGGITVSREDDAVDRTDSSLGTFALGAGRLLHSGGGGEIRFDGVAWSASQWVAGNRHFESMRLDSSLARGIVTASHQTRLPSGSALHPTLHAGVRWDGAAGSALDLGADFIYEGLAALDASVSVAALVPKLGRVRGAGAEGGLSLDAGRDRLGWKMNMSASKGSLSGGIDSGFLSRPALEDGNSTETRSSFATEIGYGLEVLAGAGLVTPFSGAEVTDTGVSQRLGLRMELGEGSSVELTGDRIEDSNAPLTGSLNFNGALKW